MILLYLNLAFKIWMLIDAGRRRIDSYWYFIIVMPFGAIIYFFSVKIHDYNLSWIKKSFERSVSVSELGWSATRPGRTARKSRFERE